MADPTRLSDEEFLKTLPPPAAQRNTPLSDEEFLKTLPVPAKVLESPELTNRITPESSLFEALYQPAGWGGSSFNPEPMSKETLTTGAEIGAGVAGTAAGTMIGGPAAGIALGAVASKAVDIMAQKAGIRPDVAWDEDVKDLFTRAAIDSIIPVGAKALRGAKRIVTGAKHTELLAKEAMTEGGVIRHFGVDTSNMGVGDFGKLVKIEPWISKSKLLAGGKIFNPKTGMYEGATGEVLSLSTLKQNIVNNLDGNAELGIISLRDQKKTIVKSLEDAFQSINGQFRKNPNIPGGSLPGLNEQRAIEWAKQIDKFKSLDPERVESLTTKLRVASSRGPAYIDSLESEVRDFLTALDTFDPVAKGKYGGSGVGGNSQFVDKKPAIGALSGIAAELKQARGLVADEIIKRTGTNVDVLNSTILNNIDEGIHSSIMLRNQIQDYQAITKKTINTMEKTAAVPGVIDPGGTLAQNQTGLVRGVWEGTKDLFGIADKRPMAAFEFAETAPERALRATQFREFGPMTTPPLELTPGVMAGFSAVTDLGMTATDANAEVANETLSLSDRAKEAERVYKISEASNRFNMDLSSFQSLQIENDKIYIDDKNEQQDIMAILMEDMEIPRSHIAKQLSLFNDPRRENELLPLPPLKKINSKEPAVRLTKGGNKPTEYRY